MNWKTTDLDSDLIDKIVKRVTAGNNLLAKPRRSLLTAQQQRMLYMDVLAAHANGCPMDLAGLLSANPYEFTHDISGIIEHIDRNTGKLNVFMPRYALRDIQSGTQGVVAGS